ncbi:MAG: tape measure protein [Bacteroidota bacterium]
MASINFATTIDTAELDKRISQLEREIKAMSNGVQREGQKMDDTFKKIGKTLAGYLTFEAGKKLISDIVNVRGEFQQLGIAYETILNNKERADKLMQDTIEFAAKTPFELTDVGQGVKKLLAFNVEAEDTLDVLRRLGDISAGLSTDLDGLVQAYGKVKAKGKLQAEEMNLFLERGIPLVSELAKEFGVAESAVYNLAEKGQVGFEDLQKVIVNLTDEGGKFANMMEKQVASLPGQVSNLKDAISRMLDEIGEKNEGLLYGGIESVANLVENYEKVIDVVKVLIATYGTYKAATIITNILQQAQAMGSLTKAIQATTIAQRALTAAQSVNPIAAVASILVGLALAISSARKEVVDFNSASQEMAKELGSDVFSLNSVFDSLKKAEKGTKEWNTARDLINSRYSQYLDNLISEKDTLEDIEEAQKRVTKAIMANAGVKAYQTKLDEQQTLFNQKFDEKLGEFTQTFSKYKGADRLTDFMTAIYDGIDKQMELAGDNALDNFKNWNATASQLYKDFLKDIAEEEIQKDGSTNLGELSFIDQFISIAKLKAEQKPIEEYFQGMIDSYRNMVDELTFDEEVDPDDLVTKVVKTNVAYWEKIIAEAKKAIDDLTGEEPDFVQLQKKYLGQIENAEKQIDLIRGRSKNNAVKTFQEEIEEKKELYEQYQQWVELFGQESADRQFQVLKSSAGSYAEYLQKEIAKLNPSDKNYASKRLFLTTEYRETTTKTGSGSIEYLQAEIARLNDEYIKTTDETTRAALDLIIKAKQKELDIMRGVTEEEIKLSEDYSSKIRKKGLRWLKDEQANLKTQEAALKLRFDTEKDLSEDAKKKLKEDIEEIQGNLTALQRQIEVDLTDAVSMLRTVFGGIQEILSGINSEAAEAVSQIGDLITGAGQLAIGITTANPEAIVSGSVQLFVTLFEMTKKVQEGAKAYEETLERTNDLVQEFMNQIGSGSNLTNLTQEYDKAIAALIKKQGELQAAINAEENRTGTVGGVVWDATDEDLLKQLQDELQATDEEIKKLVEDWEEALTGLSESDLAGYFWDAFQEGKLAAKDFADYSRKIIQQAMQKAFMDALLSSGEIERLQELIAQAVNPDGAGGYAITPEEQAAIDNAMDAARQRAEAMQKIMEPFFGSESDPNSLAGAIRKELTEETGSLLAGRLNTILLDVREQVDLMGDMNTFLASIDRNTFRTANGMDQVISILGRFESKFSNFSR